MKLMLITNRPDVARHAVDAGVDIVFVDLEKLGKNERQGHLDTVISDHDFADIARVRCAMTGGELMVRTNPLHDGSAVELDAVIEAGADSVMLPMFRSARELIEYRDLVAGRARIRALIETPEALADYRALATVTGIEAYHFGLNDLHIAFRDAFMFVPLVDGRLDAAIQCFRKAGIPYGIGGVARCGQGDVPGHMVLAEYVRRGASAVILSRTFHHQKVDLGQWRETGALTVEVNLLRKVCADVQGLPPEQLARNAQTFASTVRQISGGLALAQ